MTRGVYDVTCILTCPVAGYNMLYAKGRMPPLRAAHAKIIMEEYKDALDDDWNCNRLLFIDFTAASRRDQRKGHRAEGEAAALL